MRTLSGCLFFPLVLLSQAACTDAVDPPLLDTTSCAAAWERVTSPVPYDVTHDLLYREGTLFYASLNQRAIVAQPVTGGPSTSLAPDRPLMMTLENDRLIYRAGATEETFVALPVNGGPKEVLADLSTQVHKPGLPIWNAVTATDFYWTEHEVEATSVWKLPRAGGTSTLLAKVGPSRADGFTFFDAGLADDGVILSDRFTAAVLVPFDGSAARPLASPKETDRGTPQFAGIDRTGVYWLRERTDSGADRYDLDLSPADGGPLLPFWHDLPPHAGVGSVWPDGKGGWILFGGELARDGQYHRVVWALDGQPGHPVTHLLACSPGRSEEAYVDQGVAMAPDAIYAISTNFSAETWEIDRIALPARAR